MRYETIVLPPRANRGKRFRKSFRRKAGRFSKHFATTFEPPPPCVPRDHLRLLVPPGPNVGTGITPSCPLGRRRSRGLAISPLQTTKPVPEQTKPVPEQTKPDTR